MCICHMCHIDFFHFDNMYHITFTLHVYGPPDLEGKMGCVAGKNGAIKVVFHASMTPVDTFKEVLLC